MNWRPGWPSWATAIALLLTIYPGIFAILNATTSDPSRLSQVEDDARANRAELVKTDGQLDELDGEFETTNQQISDFMNRSVEQLARIESLENNRNRSLAQRVIEFIF